MLKMHQVKLKMTYMAIAMCVIGASANLVEAGEVKISESSDLAVSDPEILLTSGEHIVYEDTQDNNKAIAKITSVSQLRDVYPGDWTFQVLRSLVERYGCIPNYSNTSLQSDRSISRYEFAASLHACFTHIKSLLKENVTIHREDLDRLQILARDFQTELASIDRRVDNLGDRVAFLEDVQFSTTTKLNGSVIFSFLDNFSGEGDTQSAIQQQTFLGFFSSFGGRDLLSIGMAASNAELPNLASTNNGRDVGSTREGTSIWALGGSSNNNVFLLSLEYVFPVIDRNTQRLDLTIALSNGFYTSRFLAPTTGITWEGYGLGNGPLSTFAQRNPLYRLGGGAGIIANYYQDSWGLSLIYLATQSSDPSSDSGLFDGDSLTVGHLSFTPSERFSVAFTYFHNYFGPGRFAYNSQQKIDANSSGFVGTALANRFDNAGVFFDEDVPVSSNTYGIQTAYQVNPKLVISAFAAQTSARLISRGDADIWTYALNLAFPDLGKEGNLGGLIVGVEPTLTGLKVGNNFRGGFKRDISLHIEGFYKYQVTDNISITPGVIWITAPNQDADNEDIVAGAIRTTFSF